MQKSELAELQATCLNAINAADDLTKLETVRLTYMGKKGKVSALLKTMGSLSTEAKREFGPLANQMKQAVQTALKDRLAQLTQAALNQKLQAESIDLSLPTASHHYGGIHPISQVTAEITRFFARYGFHLATGPDVEDDAHNFTMLNFPPSHPARAMHDTFFVDLTDEHGLKKLLRTHTSPVQLREMMDKGAPLRVLSPGRAYRVDHDATHSPMFHQVEGLCVDENVTLGQLKYMLQTFCRHFFEIPNLKMRFRGSFFPFTEPSLEVDIACAKTKTGIHIGRGDDWLEILGAGMVHPNVLKTGGIDAEKYTGFAFGMGIERLAMLKYGMPDLRPFYTGDLRWLNHFNFTPGI